MGWHYFEYPVLLLIALWEAKARVSHIKRFLTALEQLIEKLTIFLSSSLCYKDTFDLLKTDEGIISHYVG